MKAPAKKANRHSPPEKKAGRASDAGRRLTRGRRILFSLGAFALPVFLVVLLEIGLRVAGYGYDTSFFKTERDGAGNTFLINNDQFTRRFFPPELARWPGTCKLTAEKPLVVQRIFIFGESAAMGDPQPSVGASRYLQILLREKFPGRKFEIVNLGITAINSHVILPIAQDVAARGQGDLWLIYMGNNEMVGPFGAATVFGSRAPPLAAVRGNLAVQKTRVGQLAANTLGKLRRQPGNSTWGGMKMFLNNQTSPDDPRRETVYRNFARNLRDIVRTGQAGGAKIILSTMAVNLRDCPPFGSLMNSNLSAGERAQFESLYASARAAHDNHHLTEAAQKFEQAAGIEPKHAELQFRWAQCLLGVTNMSAAREHFQRACDVDALPFRADTRINAAIRSVAAEFAGTNLSLCDAEAALAAAATDSIAGDESFFEHVHFNFDGNYRLAKAWADQIVGLLPEAMQREAHADWASQEVCERAIGLSGWNRGFVISSVVTRMGQPPLAAQFNNPARLQVLERTLSALDVQQRQTNILEQARTDFETAVARAPTDAFLHENYANFLEATGDHERALSEYLKITELLPHDFYGCLQAGRLLGELGRMSEAEPLLRRATAQRPSLVEPWYELGVVLAARENHAEALGCFEWAAKMQPTDGRYVAGKAKMLSKLGRRVEAIGFYRDAVKLDGRSWETHFELAGELATANQVAESIDEYAAVVRLNPRHAITRVNLGVMLVRQNQYAEAIQQFEFAQALDPNNAAARDYLRQVTAYRNQRR